MSGMWEPEILIVGASARAAAQSAARGSLRVVAADLFGDADLLACCVAVRCDDYPGGLVRAAAELGGNFFLYTGALENYPEVIAELCGSRQLLGNGPGVLARARDPLVVQDILERAELSATPCKLGAQGVPVDGSWLRKPRRSAGGARIGVWRGIELECRAAEGSYSACSGSEVDSVGVESGGAQAADDDGRWYFQQYIRGEPWGAVFVAARGEAVLLGVTAQWIGSEPFHEEIQAALRREQLEIVSTLQSGETQNSATHDRAVNGAAAAVTLASSSPADARLASKVSPSTPVETREGSGFQYVGSIGPLRLDEVVRAQLERLGNVLSRELGLVGLFGVDVIVGRDNVQPIDTDVGARSAVGNDVRGGREPGRENIDADVARSEVLECGVRVWPIEINPRYTASVEVLERACGLSALRLHVEACRLELESGQNSRRLLDLDLARRWEQVCSSGSSIFAGKAYLFAEESLTIDHGIAAWLGGRRDVFDVPVEGSVIEAGRPILTVIEQGRNRSEAAARVGLACREIWIALRGSRAAGS